MNKEILKMNKLLNKFEKEIIEVEYWKAKAKRATTNYEAYQYNAKISFERKMKLRSDIIDFYEK